MCRVWNKAQYKKIWKSSGVGGDTTNFNLGRPTNEVKYKSDSLDVFSTKPLKNTVENNVEVETVDFVLVDNSVLSLEKLESLENDVVKMRSHQNHKKESSSSGKAKRKRKSLEGSPEN